MAEFLKQAWPYAAAVLVVLGIIALVYVIVILVRAARSMKHINTITAEAEKEVTPALKRVDPLVERAELTVDTLNLELLRVDAILEDVEQVTDVAGKTADTVNTITTAPTNAVAGLAEKLRGSLGGKRKAKLKESRIVFPIGDGTGAGAADEGAASDEAQAADEGAAAQGDGPAEKGQADAAALPADEAKKAAEA